MKSAKQSVPSGAAGICFSKMMPRDDYDGAFVYAMRNKRNGYIKLGLSREPIFREKTLQAEEPEITLLFSLPGDKNVENDLHYIFGSKRLRGEWFRLSQSDIYGAYDYALTCAVGNDYESFRQFDMTYLSMWAACGEAVN